jgi:3-hydroxyacyl-[acyl-carrier-protein] dehydratase
MENLDFAKGHFKEYPVTPWCYSNGRDTQIGLVCLGIFLLDNTLIKNTTIALTSTH